MTNLVLLARGRAEQHFLIKVAESDDPALHLFLGSDAYGMAQQKLKTLETALETNKELSHSTDFKN